VPGYAREKLARTGLLNAVKPGQRVLITAVDPEKARVPIVLPSDRAALEAAFRSIGLWSVDTARMAWIINTSDLRRLAVLPALAAEARAKGLAVSAEGFALPFGRDGELKGLRPMIEEMPAK
jgi:hypothetical protein